MDVVRPDDIDINKWPPYNTSLSHTMKLSFFILFFKFIIKYFFSFSKIDVVFHAHMNMTRFDFFAC